MKCVFPRISTITFNKFEYPTCYKQIVSITVKVYDIKKFSAKIRLWSFSRGEIEIKTTEVSFPSVTISNFLIISFPSSRLFESYSYFLKHFPRNANGKFKSKTATSNQLNLNSNH